jgi:UDP-glucose 4-epimerase
MPSKALVTGGAGFIGSHLSRALLANGSAVRVLDNFATGNRKNLSEIESDIELIDGDLRDLESCRVACRGIEVVYHLAALGSVPRSIEDPLTTNAVNVQGTLNLLVAARDAHVRRVVFSSSSSVYGDTPVLPKHEQMRPSPRSPYAVSKLTGEEYCRAFTLSYGLETVALRYFNVFGPRQDPGSPYAAVIPRFASALLEGRDPVIYGDGLQSRDFTYVSNVVEANLLASTSAAANGQVCNIACSEQITLLDLLDQISKLLGRPASPEYRPARSGDVKHSRADISAASALLGYRPLVSFAEGLATTISWYSTTTAGCLA